MTAYTKGKRKPKEMHGEGSSANNGAKQTPEYRAWRSMFQRCYDETCEAYERYGGRGIKVCKRWRDSYRAFLKDVGRKPSSQYTLNRIDNNRGYEPGNVEWATKKSQARNTANVERAIRLKFKGEKLTLLEWGERLGLHAETIRKRLNRGWTVAEALNTPNDTWLHHRWTN